MIDPVQRRVLSVLAERENMTRTELAEVLVADEDVPATDVHRLEITLHHGHLPKLESEQYLEYDPRNGDIALRERPPWKRS